MCLQEWILAVAAQSRLFRKWRNHYGAARLLPPSPLKLALQVLIVDIWLGKLYELESSKVSVVR
jgi:hypothetical protein